MEFVPKTLVTNAPVSNWRDLKRLLLELLSALKHAHARGAIHRDLKPSNILIDEAGLSRVSDFGVAFTGQIGDHGHEQMRTAGTPEYMAPEQCHGMWRDFGPWTDLYALGCIAFEVCTGSPPFQDSNALSLMLTKLKGDLPELVSQITVPDGFEQWVKVCLQRNPQDRFQTAADAMEMLRTLRFDDHETDDELFASMNGLHNDPDTFNSVFDEEGVGHSVYELTKDKSALELAPIYEGLAFEDPQDITSSFSPDWRKSQSHPDEVHCPKPG